ncbi:MAG: sugar phosphate isomerase/epimerase [Acidobacteriota bacterium]|nr:sugar phosphate isomerase/epimerase [Acidobacteriota bacterium]
MPLRFAVCNELFGSTSLANTCAAVREIGYEGIEIAPFTLAENPIHLTVAERASIRQEIETHHLQFVGLHWLLAAPKGLHVTAPDKDIRKLSWKFLASLIDLCADLRGPRAESAAVMVFGSPQQRSAIAPVTPKEAAQIMTEGLASLAPQAYERGVQILVEPLSKSQTDVITSLAEAVAIVEQIGSPAIQTMFDVHNAVDETLPHPQLIERFLPHIRHVHVNEMDGREPGTADYDFGALLTTLEYLNYSGWVSLEAFDFSRDSRQIAAGALQHLQAVLPSNSTVQEL